MRSEPSSTEEWNQIGNTSSSEDWIRREVWHYQINDPGSCCMCNKPERINIVLGMECLSIRPFVRWLSKKAGRDHAVIDICQWYPTLVAFFLSQGHWPSIVEWSESLASETDLLRVDFLVSRSGENSGENSGSCVASEMCAFLWPQSTFFNGAHERLEKMLLDHHEIQGLDYAEEAFFVAKGETMNPTA